MQMSYRSHPTRAGIGMWVVIDYVMDSKSGNWKAVSARTFSSYQNAMSYSQIKKVA